MSAFTKVLVVVVLVLSAVFAASQVILFNRREAYAQELKATRDNLQTTSTNLADAKAKLADANRQLDDTKGKLQNENAGLRTELENQKANVAQLKLDLDAQKTAVGKLAVAVQAQEASLQLKDETITSLKDNVAKLNKSIEANVAEIDGLNTKVRDRDAKIGALENNLLDVKREYARADVERAALNAQIGELIRRGIDVGKRYVPDIAAKVVGVDNELGAAVIDKGAVDQVKVNAEFTIYRDSEYVGSLVIHDVRQNMAAGRVISLSSGKKLSVGDNASTAITPIQ